MIRFLIAGLLMLRGATAPKERPWPLVFDHVDHIAVAHVGECTTVYFWSAVQGMDTLVAYERGCHFRSGRDAKGIFNIQFRDWADDCDRIVLAESWSEHWQKTEPIDRMQEKAQWNWIQGPGLKPPPKVISLR